MHILAALDDQPLAIKYFHQWPNPRCLSFSHQLSPDSGFSDHHQLLKNSFWKHDSCIFREVWLLTIWPDSWPMDGQLARQTTWQPIIDSGCWLASILNTSLFFQTTTCFFPKTIQKNNHWNQNNGFGIFFCWFQHVCCYVRWGKRPWPSNQPWAPWRARRRRPRGASGAAPWRSGWPCPAPRGTPWTRKTRSAARRRCDKLGTTKNVGFWVLLG